jgi:hypothetical protein
VPLGGALLARLRGRCDLVLHGHRHVPSDFSMGADAERPLRILNAGSTTELGRVRVLSARRGRLGEDGWLELHGDDSQPVAPVGGGGGVSGSSAPERVPPGAARLRQVPAGGSRRRRASFPRCACASATRSRPT